MNQFEISVLIIWSPIRFFVESWKFQDSLFKTSIGDGVHFIGRYALRERQDAGKLV